MEKSESYLNSNNSYLCAGKFQDLWIQGFKHSKSEWDTTKFQKCLCSKLIKYDGKNLYQHENTYENFLSKC